MASECPVQWKLLQKIKSARDDKSKLKTAADKYRPVQGEAKVEILYLRVAKEALFGNDVFMRCTVGGCQVWHNAVSME